MRLWVILVLVALAGSASAQKRTEDAKREFQAGRAAYEKSDYAGAYEHFKRSFLLSQEPALLYNISSALQGLGRPGEAADALRDYLKIVPGDPERPQIVERIDSLSETQRLLDREAAATAREVEARARQPANAVERQKLAADAERFRKIHEEEQIRLAVLQQAAREEELRLSQQQRRLHDSEARLDAQRLELTAGENALRERERKRRRGLAIGLSIGGAVVVGVAVGLALGLNQGTVTHTPADIGPVQATP